MRLRACAETDLPAILVIERRLFPQDAWSRQMFEAELAAVPATRHYLVAEDGGAVGDGAGRTPSAVVGYAGLHVAGDQADVLTVAVARDHWGRGIGRALLAALVDEAAGRRAAEIFLDVRVDNDRARELYERAGFERIGLRRGYYHGGIDAVTMRRRLRTDEEVAGG